MATTRATELGQLAKLVTVDSDGNSVISGTFDATLPPSGVVVGVHGSASSVPIMSVTAQGIIDSVGSAPIVSTNSFDFDSATGQLTLGFSDATSLSQNITLDPFTTADLTEGSNLYYTDARFDSAFGVKTTADLTEGSNLYYTDARFDSAFGDKSTTNLTEGDNLYYTQGRFDSALGDKTTDNLTEGSNLYYTTARADSDAKAAISVTDAGGDGSLIYSSGTITYTGPSASETRAHFSGGTGVDISSGVVSIGQNVDSSATVVFQTLETTGNIVVGGNLQVNGSTTTVSSQNLQIEDNMFYLNQLESDGSPTIEVDVGFAANVNDTGSYAHTGFFRDATDATWKLFDGYTPEPDSDLDIDINHASFSYADLQVADLTAAAVTSTGLTVNGDLDVSNNNPRIRFDDTDTSNNAEITVDNTQLRIEVDEDNAVGSSQIKFRIDGSDTAVLNSSGRLGIGTSNPGGILHLEASTSRAILKSTGADEASINFNTPSGNTYMGLAGASGELIAGSAAGDYVVSNRTGGDIHLSADTAFTDAHLSIIETGNVGIGNTAPDFGLTISSTTAGGLNSGILLGLESSTNTDPAGYRFKSNSNYYQVIYDGSKIDWKNFSGGSYVSRMSLLNNGNLGIGLTSPAKLLHINGETQIDNGPLNLGGSSSINGNNPQLRRTNSSNDLGISAGGSDRITVLGSNGNVGISTASPSNQLEVTGGTNRAVISVTNADLGSLHYADRNGRYLTSNGTGWTSGVDGADPGIVIGSDNSSGQIKGVGIVLHNDNNSDNQYSPTISFGNKSNSGSYNTSYAHIIGRKTGQGADSNWSAGEIGFYTQPVGGYVTNDTRLIIKSDGKVGIGTNTPGRLLDVGGSASGELASFKGGNANQVNIAHSSNSSWGLLLGNSDSTNTSGYHYSTSGINNTAAVINVNNDALHFGTNNAARMSISHNGYVGIGTNNPEGHLDVNVSGVNDTQAQDWTSGTSEYTSQTGGTLRNIILSNRHGATKHTFYGYTGATLEFRNANTSYEWEAGKIMGVVDPMNTTTYKGGLIFFANSDGNTSNNPAGRLQNGADSVVHMALADKRVYIPYTMNIGNYTSTYNYSLNQRPQIKLQGSYPHLFLIDDANSNTTHGPVISMGGFASGTQRRWNIGVAASNPSNLSIGYYDNNANPHYGTGTGWGSDAFTRFSVYTDRTEAKGSLRSSIFYDLDDTTYYADPASSTTAFNGNGNGVFKSNSSDSRVLYLRQHVTNGGNIVQFIDQNGSNMWELTARNNNFYIYNNQNGLGGAFKIHPGNNNTWINPGSSYASDPGYRLRVSGNIYSDSDIRSPIFYESANTAYYFDGGNTGDSIRVAGDIVAYYSDERLKDKEGNISGAIDKVSKLNGFYYRANKKAQELGYDDKPQVGVSAQEVEAVLPEVVKDAPIGHGYKTVKYDRMVPLLIEAIKEQQEIINKQSQDIDELKQLVKQLMENK